jgi:micrococcal nuclease
MPVTAPAEELTTPLRRSRQGSGLSTVSTVLLALACAVLGGCAGDPISYQVEQQATTSLSATPSPEAVAAAIAGPGKVTANATIVAISDGDTVTVKFSGTLHEKVRLIGIDTPETHRPNTPVQCFGPEATRFISALLPLGTAVRIERDVEERDRYARLLGYVYRAHDGLFINQAIAEAGYANLLTYPPNVAHVDTFTEAVRSARINARGLWSACPTTVGS